MQIGFLPVSPSTLFFQFTVYDCHWLVKEEKEMESSDEDEFGTALVRGKISNGVLLIFFFYIYV